MSPAKPGDRPAAPAPGDPKARPPGRPAAAASPSGAVEDLLTSLRRLRVRARVRARSGLLDEAVETMTGLGFQVARFARGEDLLAKVREIVPAGANVVYQTCAVGRALHLDEILRAEGRNLVVLPGDGEPLRQNGSWREHLLAAQFGITGATALVADTGSVVLAEELGFGRAASNIPPVHIALVTADSVVENLVEAAVLARGYATLHLNRSVPRYLSFISGPSKTADIGFQLVTGMHGPRAAHVLIWEQPKAEGTDEDALKTWVLA